MNIFINIFHNFASHFHHILNNFLMLHWQVCQSLAVLVSLPERSRCLAVNKAINLVCCSRRLRSIRLHLFLVGFLYRSRWFWNVDNDWLV